MSKGWVGPLATGRVPAWGGKGGGKEGGGRWPARNKTGDLVAVKIIPQAELTKNEKLLRRVEMEVNILRLIGAPSSPGREGWVEQPSSRRGQFTSTTSPQTCCRWFVVFSTEYAQL